LGSVGQDQVIKIYKLIKALGQQQGKLIMNDRIDIFTVLLLVLASVFTARSSFSASPFNTAFTAQKSIESFISDLSSEDALIRKNSVENIGKFGDWRALNPLIQALEDTHCSVRQAAISALGNLGEAQAVAPLIDVLAGKPILFCIPPKKNDFTFYEEIYISATNALAKIGDPEAIDPLIRTLKHENRAVRKAAAEALGKFQEKRVVYGLPKFDTSTHLNPR